MPITRSSNWIVGQPPQTLRKHPGETRICVFDFGKLTAGGNLGGTPTVAQTRSDFATSDLTLGTISRSGNVVSFTVAGGVDGITYTVKVTAATAQGETLIGIGTILVSVDPDCQA